METDTENGWSFDHLEAIYLSATNYCNLRCPMCPNSHMKTKRGFLDRGLFERLVDELATLAARPGAAFKELHFANDGEPFLHPGYVEMIEHIDRNLQGLRVFINTNACLLNEAKIDRLLALNRNHYYIVFSVDASYAELYGRIRVGGDFEKVQRNVRYTLERKMAADIKNPYAAVQFVVMPENEHDRHAFYWQWEPYLGPVWKSAGFTWWPNQIEVNRAHVAWKELTAGWGSQEITPLAAEPPVAGGADEPAAMTCLHPQHPASPGRVCAWPWRRLSVGWDGGVGLCCWHWESYGLLGTLRECSLREVFEGARAEDFRQRFWEGQVSQLPVCSHCDRRDWWHDPALEAELAETARQEG